MIGTVTAWIGGGPGMALVRRELLVTLRQSRSAFFLIVLTATAACMVIANWPTNDEVMLLGAQTSRKLVDLLFTAAYFGCALIVPALAGSAIVIEKERDCYDLLHCSLIGPNGILHGKFINTVGFYTLLFIALFPLFGVTFFLVGISWFDLLTRAIALYATVGVCAAWGLLCSAGARRSATALAWSYAGMLLFGGVAYAINRASGFHPASILFVSVLQCIGIAVFLGKARFLLNRPPKPHVVKHEDIIEDKAVLNERRVNYPYYLFDPCKPHLPIGDRYNPMFLKEFRWGGFGRVTTLVRMSYRLGFAYFFVFAIFSSGVDIQGNDAGRMSGMAIQIALACLAAPALLGNSFTTEHEQGNLDMLRMTLLEPRHIMLGKLGAGLVNLCPFLFASALVATMLGLFSLTSPVSNLFLSQSLGLATIGLSMVVAVMAALAVSLHAKSTGSAVLVTYGLCCVYLAGPDLILTQAARLFGPDAYRNMAARVDAAMAHLPGWMDVSLVSPMRAYQHAAGGRDWFGPATANWAASMSLFALITLALYAYACAVFHHRYGRGH